MSKYLLEIGVEEFPAAYIESTKQQLTDAFSKLFEEHGVTFESIRVDSTPRRFVVRIDGLADVTASQTIETKGPAARIAFDEEGNPTKALEGFMKRYEVTADELTKRTVGKDEYVFVEKTEEGMPLKDLLSEEIPKIIRGLNFPKSMKWGGRDFRFARPIRWFVSLLNNVVLPFDLEGIPVDRYTRGHRVLGSDHIQVNNSDDFENLLLENYVMLDEEKRKEVILVQGAKLVREKGGNLAYDEDLIDEIVHLVEYPTPLIGNIPNEYMQLPDSVILTPMKDHLRYIPVLNDKNQTMPYFVTVRNGDKTGLETVREGNEKVLTPRLEDAKFFYEEDRKKPLEDYVNDLEQLTFHKKLGNMYDKTIRVKALAQQIGEMMGVGESTLSIVSRAAELSKADLMTHMVIEFTELQGMIGGIYAEESGESKAVSQAIAEQYLPTSARGAIPKTTTGTILSLADKLDTLCGLFAIGEKVSGSNDQFGLRRQALGILQILLANQLDLNLEELVRESLYNYVNEKVVVFPYEETKDKILQFIYARFKNRLIEDNYRYDIIDSVVEDKPNYIYEALLRISAVTDFLSIDHSQEILTSLQRVNSLAEKAEDAEVNPELFESDEERNLYTLDGNDDAIEENIESSNYKNALDILATSSPVIDNFLDNTMVMVEDEAVRNNRLALLKRTNDLIRKIFDPTKIVKEA